MLVVVSAAQSGSRFFLAGRRFYSNTPKAPEAGPFLFLSFFADLQLCSKSLSVRNPHSRSSRQTRLNVLSGPVDIGVASPIVRTNSQKSAHTGTG